MTRPPLHNAVLHIIHQFHRLPRTQFRTHRQFAPLLAVTYSQHSSHARRSPHTINLYSPLCCTTSGYLFRIAPTSVLSTHTDVLPIRHVSGAQIANWRAAPDISTVGPNSLPWTACLTCASFTVASRDSMPLLSFWVQTCTRVRPCHRTCTPWAAHPCNILRMPSPSSETAPGKQGHPQNDMCAAPCGDTSLFIRDPVPTTSIEQRGQR